MIPVITNDAEIPGAVTLSFDLSRLDGLTALRLDLLPTTAYVKIFRICLERQAEPYLDLTQCMVTTGTSFGDMEYFFDGAASPHIGFSPLSPDDLQGATKLTVSMLNLSFGPLAVKKCVQVMGRIYNSFQEAKNLSKERESRIAALEAAHEYAKETIKKLVEKTSKKTTVGHSQSPSATNSPMHLSAVPVQNSQPGKIAIHLHLYYMDMADELLGHIACMPCGYDLFITVCDRDKVHSVEEKARNICGRCMEGLQVVAVPNRGRDISAFLVTLSPLYRKYDYICHVHSKKSLFTGKEQKAWCDYLFTSLFGGENHVRRIFGLFAMHPSIGLVYPATAEHMPYWCHSWLSNGISSQELFRRLKAGVDTRLFIDYPVGSMMWARSEALAPLFDMKLSFEDFPPEPIPNDGTLSHAIERSFCIAAAMKKSTFAEVDIRDGTYTIGVGRKNLWQYWNRSPEHLERTLS
ncbi:MAG TPA: rhamnan synthesis F family protein, partial [Deltaproteobacteria bacterium]|nr:rhamnan synthesis F family protein [Deltaproteobacteria bacterium]